MATTPPEEHVRDLQNQLLAAGVGEVRHLEIEFRRVNLADVESIERRVAEQARFQRASERVSKYATAFRNGDHPVLARKRERAKRS